MKTKLGDICEIQSGLYVKPDERKENSAVLVNLKDFDENLDFIEPSAFTDPLEIKEKYIIGKNDVLVSTKLKFKAYRLPRLTDDIFVATNSFAILRPKDQNILPDYLKWYINHPDRKAFFSFAVQGTPRVPYIRVKKLAEMKIDLPDLETQKQFVSIDSLMKREKQLTQKILNKKEMYIQTLLSNTVKK